MWNDAAGGFIPDLYEPEYNNTLIFLQKYGLQTAAGRLNRCPQQQDRYRRWLNWSPLWCSFLFLNCTWMRWYDGIDGGGWHYFFACGKMPSHNNIITGTICIHETVYYKNVHSFMKTPSFTFKLLGKCKKKYTQVDSHFI